MWLWTYRCIILFTTTTNLFCDSAVPSYQKRNISRTINLIPKNSAQYEGAVTKVSHEKGWLWFK